MLFAGPVCFNPNTEKEAFAWGLALGALLLGILSVVFGLTALVVKLRQTFNPGRKRWAKRYGLSILAFFLLMGLGWLIGSSDSANDYCRSAESSLPGNALLFLAVIAGLTALVSCFGYIFSFTRKPKD